VFVALPGAIASALLLVGGAYLAVTNLIVLLSDDEFGLSLWAAAFGAFLMGVGLTFAAATVVVSLPRAPRWLLVTTVALSGAGIALALVVVASTPDRVVSPALAGVLAYLGLLSVVRLYSRRGVENA
jgi:hypothetical protein